MSFMDAFTSEEPVTLKQTNYFNLMKEAAEAELLRNGIKAGVPAPYLEALHTGKINFPEPEPVKEAGQQEKADGDLWGVLAAAAKVIFNEFEDFRDVEEMQAAIEVTVEGLARARILALEGMEKRRAEDLELQEQEKREALEDLVDEFTEFLFKNYPQKRQVQIRILFNHDTIEAPDGEKGFGVFIPEKMKIYVAADIPEPEETVLHTLAHEYAHFQQYCEGQDFDEDLAEEIADGAVEIFKARREKKE